MKGEQKISYIGKKAREKEKKKGQRFFLRQQERKISSLELESPGRLIAIERFPCSHCWDRPSLSLSVIVYPTRASCATSSLKLSLMFQMKTIFPLRISLCFIAHLSLSAAFLFCDGYWVICVHFFPTNV